MQDTKLPILISIQGITASGKSGLAIELANVLEEQSRTINSHNSNSLNSLDSKCSKVWIVNADSRQIYKYLDIGTAKIEGKWEVQNNLEAFYYKGIPHFLIDFVLPDQDYNLVNFIQDFKTLLTSPKLPEYIILVGGSGLYAKAILSGQVPIQINPEFENDFNNLREILRKKTLLDLQKELQANILPTERLEEKLNINSSDWQNPRRLINKILAKKSVENNWIYDQDTDQNDQQSSLINKKFSKIIQFGLEIEDKIWQEKLLSRIKTWTEDGKLEEETHKIKYLGYDKIRQFGFEYSITLDYLDKKVSKQEWADLLFTANRRYAKKQQTWLNKQPEIIWIRNLNDILKTLHSSGESYSPKPHEAKSNH